MRLTEQFESAGLCVFNNNWHQIYDFNAYEQCDGDESHWSIVPTPVESEQSLLGEEVAQQSEISLDPRSSIVPVTAGIRSPGDFACLVLLFSDGNERSRARKLINTLTPDPVSQRELKVRDLIPCHAFRSTVPADPEQEVNRVKNSRRTGIPG